MPWEEFRELMENKPMAELRAFHDGLRERALTEFADMSDAELDGPSIWWEGETYNLEYRIRRFDAHLRQHTIQAEKTLELIGRPPNESKRLLRLVYNALAEVENMTLGAADAGLDQRQALAEQICARADDVAMLVHRAWDLAEAVPQGKLDRVQELLSIDPRLANTLSPNRLPALMTALYHNRPEIAEALAAAGAELDIFSAAALGRLEAVQAAHEEWPGWIHEFSRDGYTPLLLACFFGREAVARWLLEQGANIHATAKNEMAVQPIHAAAAGPSLAILTLLLERGANANARQSGGFTPLHTAAQNNDSAMADLLLAHGADPTLANDEGKTPLDLAQEAGHQELFERMKAEG
jgi:ankyrin repeat protein